MYCCSRYSYIDEPQLRQQLLELSRRVTKPTKPTLNLQAIHDGVADLPAKQIRHEVQEVCKKGFSFKSDPTQWHKLRARKVITKSAQNEPHKLHTHFIKELQKGHIYCNNKFKPKLYIPLFIKEERNKYRIINDFSAENNGVSLNSITPHHVATVELPTTMDLIQFMHNDGNNQYAGKNDGESFFRQIPLAQDEWPLAAYWWCGNTYVDTRMPWGARRSARIAHYFSLAITHIAYKYIPRQLQPCILNYIDDHMVRGRSRWECAAVHYTYIKICEFLGVKLKQTKTIIAEKIIIALGFQFDLNDNARTIEVEPYKQQKYQQNLQQFQKQQIHTTKQGQSIAGQMEHVAPIKWPLKCYIRALRNVIPKTNNPQQTFKLTTRVHNALNAWRRAMPLLTPTKMTRILHPPTEFDRQLITDSSNVGYSLIMGTKWAYGAFFDDEVDPNDQHNIKERELLPIGIGLTLFGPELYEMNVLIWSDNDNAVQGLTNKDIRSEKAQELVVYICELAMKYNFRFYIQHIPGKDNQFADALSRLQIPKFLKMCNETNKTIDPQPTPHTRIPIQLGTQKHTQLAPVTIDHTL